MRAASQRRREVCNISGFNRARDSPDTILFTSNAEDESRGRLQACDDSIFFFFGCPMHPEQPLAVKNLISLECEWHCFIKPLFVVNF